MSIKVISFEETSEKLTYLMNCLVSLADVLENLERENAALRRDLKAATQSRAPKIGTRWEGDV